MFMSNSHKHTADTRADHDRDINQDILDINPLLQENHHETPPLP